MILPDTIRLTDPVPGYPVFEIIHPKCTARVALHGAHVMSWKPTNEEEVLYLSPDSAFKEGKAIRGGIPICWPWFGKHPADPEQPSHGLVRTRFWTLLDATEDSSGATLRFEFQSPVWNAEVTVHAGEALKVSLCSKNASDTPIIISGALHTYLAVSDIGQVRIMNLNNDSYLDTVGEPEMRVQNGDVAFNREVDRVYDSASRTILIDDLFGRTLLIEKSGSPSTVVWNPWIEKSTALSDLPDDDYRRFCCIEAAIANDKAETVMPGCWHVLMTRISVEN